MVNWFSVANFRYNDQPSAVDGMVVPAYRAGFYDPRTLSIVTLCLLHDDELGRFPYSGNLLHAIASTSALGYGFQ